MYNYSSKWSARKRLKPEQTTKNYNNFDDCTMRNIEKFVTQGKVEFFWNFSWLQHKNKDVSGKEW